MDLAPHFRQVSATPVFIGDGADDLACCCAGSTLVRGHRPGTLVAISIECGACGAVITTPGLNPDQVVPFGARMVERNGMAMPEPFVLPPAMVLADRDELARVDLLCRPHNVPAGPFEMSAATLAAAAADYDRLTGGQLAAHRAAVPPNVGDAPPGLARLPLAWALGQLEPGVDSSGWWCLAKEPDAIATAQLGAFRDFLHVWARHPLFPAMAASAAANGFSTHAVAVFAAARCMAASGNRVSFTPPDRVGGRIEGFHIETGSTEMWPIEAPPSAAQPGGAQPIGTRLAERVPVLVRRFDRFDWPHGGGDDVAAVRAAAIDALIASQAWINPRQPGVLVLSVGCLRRMRNPVILEGVRRTLHERERRHRGLAAVALLLPALRPTGRSDQVMFGWTFVPFANPHHSGGGIRLAAPPGAATSGSATPPPAG